MFCCNCTVKMREIIINILLLCDVRTEMRPCVIYLHLADNKSALHPIRAVYLQVHTVLP